MAHRKAGGTAKNLQDSGPQYLGVKIPDGGFARVGQIIVRQRGTKVEPGKNVRLAKDYTIFAMKDGTVSFRTKRKTRYDGSLTRKKVVDVK